MKKSLERRQRGWSKKIKPQSGIWLPVLTFFKDF